MEKSALPRTDHHFYWIASQVSMYSAVLGTAVTAGSQLFGGIDSPRVRWVTWLVIASLFWLSVWLYKPRSASVLGSDGLPVKVTESYRWLKVLFASFFTLLLASDIAMWLVRSPIEYDYVERNIVKGIGYTSNRPDNILIQEDVRSVYFVTTPEDRHEFPFSGFEIGALIQKSKGFDRIVLHSFKVRVTRFEHAPEIRAMIPAGAGPIDKIQVSCFLSNRDGDPLPWNFDADFVSMNYDDSKDPKDILPVQMEDLSPLYVRYYLSAEDAGVYWIEPIILVSAGLGRPKEIVLSETPVAMAFGSRAASDEFDELDALSSSTSEWAPWPPISESERRDRLKFLQNPPPKFDIPGPILDTPIEPAPPSPM
jgi:hypothetical protein